MIGQRDNFYDISRIVRKGSAPAPTGRLLIIYDYFEHGTGDLFTVDSYVDVSGQMGYDDIPVYIANKLILILLHQLVNLIYEKLLTLDQRLKTLPVHHLH